MIASIDLVARHEPLDFDRAGVLNPRPRRGNNLLLGGDLLFFRLMCAAPHRRWLFLSSRSLRSAVGPRARFLARLLELLILNDEKLTLTDLVAPALLTGVDTSPVTVSTSCCRRRFPVVLLTCRKETRSLASTAG